MHIVWFVLGGWLFQFIVWLFSPEPSLWIIAIGIGVGFTVALAPTIKNIRLAHIFFGVAWLWAYGCILEEIMLSKLALRYSIPLTFLVAGLIGVAALLCHYWVETNRAEQIASSITEQNAVPPLNKNGFNLVINSAWWGAADKRPERLQIVAGVTVVNPKGTPSAALNWEMSLEFPDKTILRGAVPFRSPGDIQIPIRGEAGKVLILKEEKYMPGVTLQALGPGDARSGWLLAVFDGISDDEIYAKKPLLVMSCRDIEGNSYYARANIGDKKRGIVLPGEPQP